MKNNSYTLKDMYCSAYLMACGIKLKGHHREGPITIFEFEYSDRVQKLVSSYYAMDARVCPMQYGASIRNLKSILHSSSESNANEAKLNEGSNKCKQ